LLIARRRRSDPRYFPGVGDRERSLRAFSTVILRPSTSWLLKLVTQAFACSTVSTVINPKPLDSCVRGSVTSLILLTFPYLENFLLMSELDVLGFNPDTYRVVTTLEDSSFLGLLDLDSRLGGEPPRRGDLDSLAGDGDLERLLPGGGGGGE